MTLFEFKYSFTVRGVNSLIENHADLISPDFSIRRHEEDDSPPQYTFTSHHLNDLTDPVEIWARGLFILNLYRGTYNLNTHPNSPFDFDTNFHFVRLYDVDTEKDITPSNHHELAPWVSFSQEVLKSPIPPGCPPPSYNPICNRIYLSRTNDSLRNILMQCSNELNWISLYSILDSIKTYSRTTSKKHFNSVLKQAGFTEKDVKKFTGTANNFGILGTSARHGDLSYPSPSNTMTLSEARRFMLKLTNTFLQVSYQC